MKVQREELIRKLESVQPGLAIRETLEQSNTFVFYHGDIHTLNDEIYCRCPSDLDPKAKAAVPAAKLLEQLGKWAEDEIDLTFGDAELLIQGKGQKAGVRLEKEIALPIKSIEKPIEWKALPAAFAEAVGIVGQCAAKQHEDFKKMCVNLHPQWVEAWDNHQIARYELKTGLKAPVLVRQASIQHVVTLGMTKFSETEGWLHFKNPNGLQLSCRRYVDEFPSDDLTKYLDVKGAVKTQLPKGLAEAADKAAVFTTEAEVNLVRVKLKPNRAWITGTGVTGWYTRGPMRVTYDGPRIEFLIAPKLLGEIVNKHPEVGISSDRLSIDGGSWKMVAYLSPVEEESHNGQVEEEAVVVEG